MYITRSDWQKPFISIHIPQKYLHIVYTLLQKPLKCSFKWWIYKKSQAGYVINWVQLLIYSLFMVHSSAFTLSCSVVTWTSLVAHTCSAVYAKRKLNTCSVLCDFRLHLGVFIQSCTPLKDNWLWKFMRFYIKNMEWLTTIKMSMLLKCMKKYIVIAISMYEITLKCII